VNDSSRIVGRFGLEAKTALITGSAQRMGFEISQILCQEGMKIAIVDINKNLGVNAAKSLNINGGIAEFFHVDLSSKDSIFKMVDAVATKFGSIDLLVNNARSPRKNSDDQLSIEDWETSLSIMLSAPYYCSVAVIPYMERSGGGNIINISSVVSTHVCSESADYHAAKAGLNHLTRYLALHSGPKGIRVNAIAPGLIIKEEGRNRFEQDITNKNLWEWCHPLRKAGDSSDVGNAICFLASDLSRFITGQVLVVDGGLTLAEPGFMVDKFSEKNK